VSVDLCSFLYRLDFLPWVCVFGYVCMCGYMGVWYVYPIDFDINLDFSEIINITKNLQSSL